MLTNCNFYLSRVMRKPTFWFPTWSDTYQAVQLQKMARGLKFRIKKAEGLYYLCSEISFAVTAKLICVFVIAYAKCWFSHDAAHFSYFPFWRRGQDSDGKVKGKQNQSTGTTIILFPKSKWELTEYKWT